MLYPIVANQQGGAFCNCCGASRQSLEGAGRDNKLVIDRIDNEKGYWIQNSKTGEIRPRLDNLELACKGCNNTKDVDAPKVEDRAMTPEMVVNRRSEPFFRKWIRGEVETHGKIEYDDAVNSGAEFIQVSTEATKNYLKKMLSKLGEYELGWGMGGGTFIYLNGKAPKDKPRD